jgi:hypothetical protein
MADRADAARPRRAPDSRDHGGGRARGPTEGGGGGQLPFGGAAAVGVLAELPLRDRHPALQPRCAADLRGALTAPVVRHRTGLVDPEAAGGLIRAIRAIRARPPSAPGFSCSPARPCGRARRGTSNGRTWPMGGSASRPVA